LVAALMPDGSLYTAALEAKSARTLPNIMLRYGDGLWLLHALTAGLLGMAVAASIGWFFSGFVVVEMDRAPGRLLRSGVGLPTAHRRARPLPPGRRRTPGEMLPDKRTMDSRLSRRLQRARRLSARGTTERLPKGRARSASGAI
jgi:hypothetical protein